MDSIQVMGIIALGAVALIRAVAHIRWLARFAAGARRSRGRFPPPLASARYLMSEQDLHIDYPVRLSGRPDEVYVTATGHLVPVETKTRKHPRVRLADRIQLTGYAVLLAHSRHRKLLGDPGTPARQVANHGFVRFVTPAGVQWRAVGLLTVADIVQLYRRRIALEEGRAEPRHARHPALCRRCPH